MATLSLLNYNNLTTVGLNIQMTSNDQQSPTIISGPVQTSGNTLSKTFNKITVQNVLSESHSNTLNLTNANPNAIVRKIKDFGMIGSVNNAAGAASLNMNSRKRPLMESKQNQKPLGCKTPLIASNKKPKLTKEERAALRLAKKQAKENASNSNSLKVTAKQPLALVQATKVPGTPGRKGLPLPQAVARRNARERNRVKQVNNGFAALRERIPEEVAEVFENQGSNRGTGKKLSKVETLRMAVEYIRSLERLLGFDFPVVASQHNSSSGEDSFSLIKDEFDAYSPAMDEQFDDSLSHYDNEEFFNASNSNNTALNMMRNSSPPQAVQQIQHIDMLPNITTLNGLQYIRIPGTNTYQLLTPDIFVGTAASPPSSTIDEEHFNALIDTNCSSPSLTSSPPTMPMQQQTQATSTPSPPSSSSTAINAIELTSRVTETAPVLTNTITATTTTKATNVRDINEVNSIQTTAAISSSLSSSPVPENQQQHENMLPLLPSSPSTSSQQLQQQQLQTLSPALANDQLQQDLSSTCATNQQQLQTEFLLQNAIDRQQQQQQQQQQTDTMHMIKQEYDEPSILYQQQQQQQQQLQQLYHSAMSPPIDRNTPSTSTSSSNHILPSFFPSEQNAVSFYEGVVTLKKEFDDVILDTAHGTNVLSDESMIEAIDWWDAHTPKSENGNMMM